jgi:protein-disulfide isomerase
MLNNRALEDAAGAEGLTTDEYLTQRMEARGEISDEEIATFFEEHTDQMSGSSLEDAKDRIAQFLMTQRATELVAELRAQAGAVVHLEPPRIEVDATGPSMGPDDAAVTIIEFSDFQCPYCQRVVPTLHQIMEKYPEQVRVVFRHLPLHRIHARAQAAAEASACADDQGKFWDYHDLVFQNNRQLADEDLERYATEAGLEMDDYRQCVADRKFQQEVEADANTAQSLGLSGTPAFFVNGIPLTGALPLDQFVSVIDGELARLATEHCNGGDLQGIRHSGSLSRRARRSRCRAHRTRYRALHRCGQAGRGSRCQTHIASALRRARKRHPSTGRRRRRPRADLDAHALLCR